jgi:hypothetical protein
VHKYLLCALPGNLRSSVPNKKRMMKSLTIFLCLVCATHADHWRPIVLNIERQYMIRNEGQAFTPLYSPNKFTIDCDLIIDKDSANVIRQSNSTPHGDSTIIELYESSESFEHYITIYVSKGKYQVEYKRTIDLTDLFQRFESTDSKLELNSLDFSDRKKIHGYLEFRGKCVEGCIDKNKKVEIAGNFGVTIYRY